LPNMGAGDPGRAAAMDAAAGMGRQAAAAGGAALHDGVAELGAYIEKGNDGMAVLAFIGQLLIVVAAVVGCLSVGDLLFNPIHYCLTVYLLIFALTGMLLEGPQDKIEKVPQFLKAQELIFEYAKFLTELLGRGIFYVFEASLLFCHNSPIYWIVGLYMTIVGGLTIGMFFSPEKTKKAVKVGVGGIRDATGPYAAKYQPTPTQEPA